MKVKFLLILALAFGLSISNSNAQIRQRSANQHHRINQGVKSGELTRAETRNVRAGRKDLHQDVKLAKSDGKITKGERKILKKRTKKKQPQNLPEKTQRKGKKLNLCFKVGGFFKLPPAERRLFLCPPFTKSLPGYRPVF